MDLPYFLPSIIEAYRKAMPGSTEAHILALRISANIGDRDTLERILGNADEMPAENETSPSSFETIDSFLEKFSPGKSAGTYVSEIQAGNKARQINDNQNETLRMLIKNKRYGEAIEIIEQRNLNNPQKNIYFADQMRFLQKLMTIQKPKNK